MGALSMCAYDVSRLQMLLYEIKTVGVVDIVSKRRYVDFLYIDQSSITANTRHQLYFIIKNKLSLPNVYV